MIKVFAPTDNIFNNNGDKIINPIRAVVHKEDNNDFSLDLVCSLEDLDYIQPNNIIVAPTPQGEQAFRIVSTEPTRAKITAKALHVYYDSDRLLIADNYIVNKDCNYALDYLNSNTDTPSPFTTLSDVTRLNSYRCVRTTLFEAINTILERWGGHLVRDNFNIEIRENIGQDNGVVIQYGKNLKDISVNYDWSGVVTKLLPVGKDGFTIDGLYIYSDIQYDLPYTATVSFSQDINRDDYEDDDHYLQALRDDLTAKSREFLNVSQYPAVTYTLNANIEKISDIGDTIKVYDDRLGIDITTKVLSYEYDCISGKYIQIQFGTAAFKLDDLLTSINSNIDKSINENNQTINVTLRDELSKSEEKIFNVLGNSYCIYEGDQLLIVDALPKDEAHNCIRVNSAGIAFSNNGIYGDFITAWTIDGTFNAQAINVINLTANLIKGGTLKLGSNLNQSGTLEVYDEANNLIAVLDKNGLKMYGADGSYILMNNSVGFAGYDRFDNKLFWVDRDEFHQKKSVVEDEITLCGKIRFIPIEIYNADNELTSDGVGIVSTE